MKQIDDSVTSVPSHGSSIIGSGEMADRIRSYPWQDHVLGAIESWSAELRVTVNMMLSTAEMAAVCWGPEMALLYNDAYCPCLTNRHPALGKPFWEVWAEAQSQVGEMMDPRIGLATPIQRLLYPSICFVTAFWSRCTTA